MSKLMKKKGLRTFLIVVLVIIAFVLFFKLKGSSVSDNSDKYAGVDFDAMSSEYQREGQYSDYVAKRTDANTPSGIYDVPVADFEKNETTKNVTVHNDLGPENEKGEAVVDEKDDEKVVKQRFYIVDASIQNLDATQDQVEDGVDVYCQTFLLKSANADSAKKQIELYMARKAKERAETGKEAIICKYGITINAASPVGIGSVVPEDFSMAYKHAESDFAKEVERKNTKEEDEDENSEE